MRSTILCGVCSTCLTLLVSPDSAGGGLGRARVVFRRRVLFVFWSKYPKRLFVYVYNRAIGRSLTLQTQGLWFEVRMALFFFWAFSFFFCRRHVFRYQCRNICTMMIEESSEQSRSQFYMHTECRCHCCHCCCVVCCYTAVVVLAAAAVLLLPADVRHRVQDGQICRWSIEVH